jgi:hypothetical protein
MTTTLEDRTRAIETFVDAVLDARVSLQLHLQRRHPRFPRVDRREQRLRAELAAAQGALARAVCDDPEAWEAWRRGPHRLADCADSILDPLWEIGREPWP